MKSLKLNIAPLTCLLICIGLVLNSCIKEEDFEFDKLATHQWNPNLAIPLVYSKMSLKDIMRMANAENTITYDSEQVAILVYTGEIFSLRAEEVMSIPNQSLSYAISGLPSLPSLSNPLPLGSQSQNVSFNPGGGNQLDSILFKGGNLTFTSSSTLQHDVDLTISIPALTNNGAPFTLQTTIPAGASGSSSITALNGHTLDLTKGGTTNNELDVTYDATIIGNGNPVVSSESLTINFGMDGLEFSRIFGDMNINAMAPDIDTILITIFDAASGVGDFRLVNPSMELTISNSYGLPVTINYDILEGQNRSTTQSQSITTATGLPNPWNINYPLLSEIGQIKTQSVLLTGSEMTNLINIKPSWFIYQLDASGATLPGDKSFVLDTSEFKLDVEVRLPMYGGANLFEVSDTFDFNLTGFERMEELMIRNHIINEFPVQVEVQVYFTTMDPHPTNPGHWLITDSLIPDGKTFMVPATVDGNGKTIAASDEIIDVELSPDRINNLRDAKRIIVVGRAFTEEFTSGENVKIFADYTLDIRLGARVKYNGQF